VRANHVQLREDDKHQLDRAGLRYEPLGFFRITSLLPKAPSRKTSKTEQADRSRAANYQHMGCCSWSPCNDQSIDYELEAWMQTGCSASMFGLEG
jgi:hypothetical protein